MTAGEAGRFGRESKAASARRYVADEVLRDGGSIHLRALRPDDRALLVEAVSRMSDRSMYYRFFRAKRGLTERELREFTELDFDDHVALVATLREDGEEHIIGVGRYIVSEGPWRCRRAEVAFAIVDQHQGRGIGTLLLEHLAAIARDNGIREFDADVLGDNSQMLEVFARSGFEVRRALSSGVVHVCISTDATDEFVHASEERQWAAAARSIRSVLEPASIAVIGASESRGNVGAQLIDNLVEGGFTGALYPVHPRAETIRGLRAHATVKAIGEPVELAIVAVPAAGVESVVEECARAQVRGIVVISSGFGETTAEGRALERRLVALARASGMRMVGPNCMGVINADPVVRMNATFAAALPRPGNVAIASQSGGLALSLLGSSHSANLGISSFVSVGNRADVSSNDLLAYWAEDARTEVVVLYLESFGNPRKFARLAPLVSSRKPIVAVKAGRTTAGARAAASHTAALVNLEVAVDALFAQAGVIRTDTLEDLLDATSLLAHQPLAAGSRIGVVTNAGGPGILLADACEAGGLTLPELDEATRRELRSFLPAHAGFSNPVDMTAAADGEAYRRTLEIVGADAAIDALVALYVPPLVSEPKEIAAAIAVAAGAIPAAKPLAAVFVSAETPTAALHGGPRGVLPLYRFPENAARAFAAADRYRKWRQRPLGEVWKAEPQAAAAVREIVDRILAAAAEPCWVGAADAAALLRALGIDVVAQRQVGVADAGTAAAELGYPVVVKAVAPGLLHKSDSGGVVTDVSSAAALDVAVRTMAERVRAAGFSLAGVLVQRQVEAAAEAFVGVTTDATFGPLIACGLGGTLVELLHDVSMRLAPVSDRDAAEMVENLRCRPLLEGYRGRPAADRGAFENLIRRVAALVDLVPELAELDLNPVMLRAPGQGAVVVDVRMRLLAPA